MCLPTHPPRGFCEIWENERGVWTLFGNQPPHPPTFGKDLPKNVFLDAFPKKPIKRFVWYLRVKEPRVRKVDLAAGGGEKIYEIQHSDYHGDYHTEYQV